MLSPTWVDRANESLHRAWSRGWLDRPTLEPEALLAAACKVTGLKEFGEENGWRERLHLLSSALHEEADLTPLGITIAYGQLTAALATRLRAAKLWQRHPEIAEVAISKPVIVIGQMRSGSTRMQRLLACDERLTYTRFFESWNPLPRWTPRCTAGTLDDRIARGWLALKVAGLLNPKFGVVHPVRALDPDEEIGLHNVALYGAAFEAQWRIPSFAAACEEADSAPVYAEFRRYLQTIRWMRRDRSDKPWILKIPQFGQDLRTLVDTLPDARIVVLDRAPVEVVGSSASLVYNQMAVQTTSVDPVWIGQEWLRKTMLRKMRIAEGLRHHDVPRTDIDFVAMQSNWQSEMRKVYDMLGLPFTARLQKRMGRYLANRRHSRLSRHTYDIADFGLTARGIDRAYAFGVDVDAGDMPLAAA